MGVHLYVKKIFNLIGKGKSLKDKKDTQKNSLDLFHFRVMLLLI